MGFSSRTAQGRSWGRKDIKLLQGTNRMHKRGSKLQAISILLQTRCQTFRYDAVYLLSLISRHSLLLRLRKSFCSKLRRRATTCWTEFEESIEFFLLARCCCSCWGKTVRILGSISVQNSQSGLLSWFVYRIKSMTMSPVSVSSLLMTVMSLEFFVHPPLYLEHTVLLCN